MHPNIMLVETLSSCVVVGASMICHMCIIFEKPCTALHGYPIVIIFSLVRSSCRLCKNLRNCLYHCQASSTILQVDPAEWRLEVERVAPRLKITVASDARDWRSHLDEAHKHSQEISTVWPDAQAALGAVQTEVGTVL